MVRAPVPETTPARLLDPLVLTVRLEPVPKVVEVPAAVLMIDHFVEEVDFLSIGTNDLIQYTLAIDRADESVAHLYDPLHPAVLTLIARTLAQGAQQGKPVSVCGEMAGDVSLTRLLLGMGLRVFSMHPSQILSVKQEILRSDTQKLKLWAEQVLAADEPAQLFAGTGPSIAVV